MFEKKTNREIATRSAPNSGVNAIQALNVCPLRSKRWSFPARYLSLKFQKHPLQWTSSGSTDVSNSKDFLTSLGIRGQRTTLHKNYMTNGQRQSRQIHWSTRLKAHSQLECPLGKLLNPSFKMAIFFCWHMAAVARPNGEAFSEPGSGWHRLIRSVSFGPST